MKRAILVLVAGVAFGGCARNDSSGNSAEASSTARTAGKDSRIEPNASGSNAGIERAPSVTTEPAGPSTGVGAGATASSGIGTASAAGSSANESRSAEQKLTAPAGTGAEHPTVNSNGVGNARSSAPQNGGSTR